MSLYPSSFSRLCRLPTAVVLIPCLAALLVLMSCEFDDLNDRQIIDVTIVPSSISVDQTFDGSQHFSIEITIDNFDDEIEDASAFIQHGGNERNAAADFELFDDNVIILNNIAYTWFQGFDPGVYDIGVQINSATEEVIERSRATVTITD